MPFTSSVLTVQPDWIDYNGHLNMAYYNVLFDRALDEMLDGIGLGQDYLASAGHSIFTAEAHVRYLRELNAGHPVRATYYVVDADAKRLHLFAELHHAAEGWLSATSESMALHIDMAARKVTAFPPALAAKLQALRAGDARLPATRVIGRRIGIIRPA
ncbi:MAG: thioesterase [Xanthobacteraceae bacterium]|nr:MAG: thioesterase [Xanthobacteraceae bacterium]